MHTYINPYLAIAIAAIIPLIVGSLWYSPWLFQKQWQAATGVQPGEGQKGMLLNMVFLYIFSYLIGTALMYAVIHQMGLYSMLGAGAADPILNDPNSSEHRIIAALMTIHLHSFRTFKHGAFHGFLMAFLVALPLIATSAMFEKRSVKYVLITWGYWLINFTLMGAVICHLSASPFDNLK